MREVIEVKGLADLNRQLRAVSNDAPKQLRVGLNNVADVFIRRVRPKIPFLTGNARGSLKARSTRTAARVGVGGRKAPYYPWLDFGGQGRVAGRPAKRPFIKEGRYFYPTLREVRPEIERELDRQLHQVVRASGLDED
ncbi:MAG: HK97 gp10 family phage protein [Micromonosporaceae bacterium]|nr:HK97 gp10 family phage protein [Micromonosporaceae bacterium]